MAYTKAKEVDFYTDVLLKLKHPKAKSVDLSMIVSSDSLPCDPHPVMIFVVYYMKSIFGGCAVAPL